MNVVGDITGDDWPGSSCARLLRLALAAYFGLRSSNEVFTDHKSLVKTHRRTCRTRCLCSVPLQSSNISKAWVGLGWTKLERYILDEPFFGVSQVLSDLSCCTL